MVALSLMTVFIFMMLVSMKYMSNYNMDLSMISVDLWLTYLGTMTLFMVSFLLVIMLLVVLLSYINDGALRVK